MTISQAPVLFDRDGSIGVITLNRPENRNSMTPELLDEFTRVVEHAREDHNLRCVVITGKGRCFSAGADFKSVIQRQVGDRPKQAYERSYAMYQPFLSVLDIAVPVVAALNGHTVGGGFGLSLACDIRVANRDARYGANFARLGLSPGMAVSYCLPRLIGVARANEMLLTGRLISGAEAAHIGLVNDAVAPEEVMPRAMAIATEIAQAAPIAVRMTKHLIYEGLNWTPRKAALQEAFAQAVTIETHDVKEGISALLEKRDPEFHGK